MLALFLRSKKSLKRSLNLMLLALFLRSKKSLKRSLNLMLLGKKFQLFVPHNT